MKTLRYSTQFKKDVKRYAHQDDKLEALRQFLILLKNEQLIPAENHPHPLHGNYKGCMECHIGPDFLLIWIDDKTDTIWLERLGSHSELYR